MRFEPSLAWRPVTAVLTAVLFFAPATTNGEVESTMSCDTIRDPEGIETEELERTFEAWAEALAASDPEALGDLLTEDAEFWTHGQAALGGREAAVTAFRSVFARYEMRQDFECHELVLTDRWAFVRGIEHNVLVPRGEGESVELRQRAFSVLRRGDDGTWRFARGMTNTAEPPAESSD